MMTAPATRFAGGELPGRALLVLFPVCMLMSYKEVEVSLWRVVQLPPC